MRGRSRRPDTKRGALRFALLAAALPALASCGGSVSPIAIVAGCPDRPLRGPEAFAGAPPESMIDDFEDGDLSLPKIDGRNGSWVGTLVPPAPGVPPSGMISTLPSGDLGCVASGTRSGHLISTGILMYGANWNATMRDRTVEPNGFFDATAYRGISFWIAMGDNGGSPFETPIGVTTLDTVATGTVCTVPGGVCGDYYAIKTRIPLTHTWTRWVVPFSDLVQYGFGVPLVPLRKSAIVSLIIWPASQSDIWIDDLRFEP